VAGAPQLGTVDEDKNPTGEDKTLSGQAGQLTKDASVKQELSLTVNITPRASFSRSISAAGGEARGRCISYQICDAVTGISEVCPPFVLVQGQLLVLNKDKQILKTIAAPRLITSLPNQQPYCETAAFAAVTFDARIMKAPNGTEEDNMIKDYTDWNALDSALHSTGTDNSSAQKELEATANVAVPRALGGKWSKIKANTLKSTKVSSNWDELSKNLKATLKEKRETQKQHDKNLKKLNDSLEGKLPNILGDQGVQSRKVMAIDTAPGGGRNLDWFSGCIVIRPKEEEVSVHQLSLSPAEFRHLKEGINPVQPVKAGGLPNILPKFGDFVLAGSLDTRQKKMAREKTQPLM
jgi:hypothetical protein